MLRRSFGVKLPREYHALCQSTGRNADTAGYLHASDGFCRCPYVFPVGEHVDRLRRIATQRFCYRQRRFCRR